MTATIMETAISTVQGQSPIFQKTAFEQALGFKATTDLTLRTQEGDVVTLSLNDNFKFSQFVQETQFEDGAKVMGFSLMAVAASEFSLKVRGELNDEELAAIQNLIQTLAPIAKSFFTEEGFDADLADQALDGTLGVIQDMEITLEKTMAQSVASSFFGQGTSQEAEVFPQNIEAPNLFVDSIRDLNGMVQSAVDSVFRPLKIDFPEDRLLRTFLDLKNFLTKQMVQLLAPNIPPKPEESVNVGVPVPAQSDIVAFAPSASKPELIAA